MMRLSAGFLCVIGSAPYANHVVLNQLLGTESPVKPLLWQLGILQNIIELHFIKHQAEQNQASHEEISISEKSIFKLSIDKHFLHQTTLENNPFLSAYRSKPDYYGRYFIMTAIRNFWQ